ncbi:MAG: response regulator [Thermoplasmata archaeon]|nr:response regulator [Thermoplasmata archaeon]
MTIETQDQVDIEHNTILLIEDDPNDVILIQRAFNKANINNPIQVVENGEDAIAYLEGEGDYSDREHYPIPILVLLDLKLPRKSGHEVLEWVRLQPGLLRIPIVVLSSSSQRSDVERAYDLGANSYMIKPVNFDNLLEMIKTIYLYWLILNEKPEKASGGSR